METKTFVISTSAKPEDVIIISTEKPVVVLDNQAGDGILPTKNNPLDGGQF